MRLRNWAILYSVLLLAWVAYASAGDFLGRLVAARMGGFLVRAGRGKVADPALFSTERIYEFLCLLTLAALLAGLLRSLDRWICRRCSALSRSLILAGAGFVGVNIWFGGAMRTALFWGTLWTGAGDNLVQFHFKRVLADENHAPAQAVLMGSSQTRAQIDEVLLNRLVGDKAWTTELHFPGSKAVDLWLTWRRLETLRPDFVLLYVSEAMFCGEESPATQYFLSWRDLMALNELGALAVIPGKSLAYGLLGDASPLFYGREPLSGRVLGRALIEIRQSTYDAALAPNLEERAVIAAEGYRAASLSEVQTRAFKWLVRDVARSGARLVVFEGQFNPLLGARVHPELRPAMKELLRRLAREYSRFQVIDEADMPRQVADDYEDLTHVSRVAQERFTRFVAALVGKQFVVQEP